MVQFDVPGYFGFYVLKPSMAEMFLKINASG